MVFEDKVYTLLSKKQTGSISWQEEFELNEMLVANPQLNLLNDILSAIQSAPGYQHQHSIDHIYEKHCQRLLGKTGCDIQ